MTCIKTGVVLKIRERGDTIYGDLHLIGDCCILYYPARQDAFQAHEAHGEIDLHVDHFQRDTSPFHVIVIPASAVVLRKEVMHPLDYMKYARANWRGM